MDWSLVWAIIRVFLLLPLVLGLAYLVIRFGLKGFGYLSTGQSSYAMSVVDRLNLGPKSSLLVVRVAGKYYLMSYNEGKTEMLHELDSYPEVELGDSGQPAFEKDIFEKIKGKIQDFRSRREG